MRAILPMLAAFALAAPAVASAQSAPPAEPADAAAPAASGQASASADVAAGQSVKDKTGAVIGEVAEVKPDASGKATATIKMGADTFAVDTSALAVQDGSAVINATQAEIQQMLKK